MFFRTRQMYARTLLRGAKTCKIEEKMVCFWSYWQILERTCTQIKKKRMPKRLFRVYFHTWKIRVKGVFWKSFYEDDIPAVKYKCPPPPDYSKRLFFKKSLSKRSLFRNLQFYINMWLFWRKNCSKQWWTFRISIYLHATWRKAEQAACYRLLLVLLIYV